MMRSVLKMIEMEADEIVLETEVTNPAALALYESNTLMTLGCGFLREKKLIAYYLNGNDAYRLKLMINTVG